MTPLFLDIETIPDESRSGLWGLPNLENLPAPGDLIAGSVENCKACLKEYAAVLPSYWLSELESLEVNGKKRISLLDALTEAKEAPTKLVSEMSFDPDTLRIIAIGYAIGDDEPVILSGYTCTEVEMLQHIWAAMANYKPWVGFNNFAFDIPAITARSAMLRVAPTVKIDWRRFGNSQIADLMQALSIGGMRRWKGLKKVAPLYGVDVPVTDVDGSDIFSLYQANDWETITKYLASDIITTRALYRKINGYFL